MDEFTCDDADFNCPLLFRHSLEEDDKTSHCRFPREWDGAVGATVVVEILLPDDLEETIEGAVTVSIEQREPQVRHVHVAEGFLAKRLQKLAIGQLNT